MKKIWIIKAGTTFTDIVRRYGDFDQWTCAALGVERQLVEVFDVEADRPLPDPAECNGVVVTGAHAMVTDALPWSVRLEKWIPQLLDASVPFLGICYGHQLLAQAMGGQVHYHPRGREIGTVKVNLLAACQDDPLFGTLRHSVLAHSILAHVVHAQTVMELPLGAVCLAGNDFEPHHALRVGDSAWGVQFHPEYDVAIMRCYIEHLTDELVVARRDVPALIDSVQKTPAARDVLKRFAQFVGENG